MSSNRTPRRNNTLPGGRPLPAPRRFLFYWLPLMGFCAAIFWQSSFPSPIKTNLFEFQDKWMHLAAYAVMAYLAARALDREFRSITARRLFLVAVIFSCLYGLSDEIHQYFVPGRFASVGDWIADTLGGIVGAGVFIQRKPKK